jgi:tetratricopeptide (TPR) repeat protein
MAANWLDGEGSGEAHFQNARALLGRVTERERLWIRSLIERGESSVEALRIFTQQYPDDRDGWYNLGNGLRMLGEREEALEAYRRAIGQDSLYMWAHVNRGMVLDELGRSEEAVRSFSAAFRIDPGYRSQSRGDINRISGFALAETGDTVAARETFELLLDGTADERANGLRSLALLEMSRGRVDVAVSRLREAIALTEATGSRLSEYRNRLYLASALASVGRVEAARAERAVAERIAREIGADPFWLAILAQQYARSGALASARGVFELMESRTPPEPTPGIRASREHVRGELALARGDHEAAVRAMEGAHGLARSPDRYEALGQAYLSAGRTEEARAVFESIISSVRLGDEHQAFWMGAHLHLGQIYEDLGEPAAAVALYRALLQRLSDGDEALLIRQELVSRLERIGEG